MPQTPLVLRRWQVGVAFFAVTVAYILGLFWVNHISARESGHNRARIADVQQSRIYSCEQTYLGVRRVFRPFFRPPYVRTQKERRNIRKFNHIIRTLISQCHAQTSTGGSP